MRKLKVHMTLYKVDSTCNPFCEYFFYLRLFDYKKTIVSNRSSFLRIYLNEIKICGSSILL